ncbi:MAG: hypothetical protein HY347_04065 [candidate division NC10 bacterium]|nr:hypothetical protein [candidate division NC10 bacterium]
MCLLLLTPQEYARGLRRGKTRKRAEATERRQEARPRHRPRTEAECDTLVGLLRQERGRTEA